MPTMKSNALLRKPPEHIHQIHRAATRFRRAMGRLPRQEDYEGVHTTTDEAIAVAYAMSAWHRAADKKAYPVVMQLDVKGLEPEADVDAMMLGREVLDGDQDFRHELRKLLAEGKSLDDIYWHFEGAPRHTDYVTTAEPGDDPAVAIFENVPAEPGIALIDALRHESVGMDDDFIRDFLTDWLASNAAALPDRVYSAVVYQQRYLTDFDLDRVVRVVAFKPWWPGIFNDWWEIDDDEMKAEAERVEGAGYRVITMEDVTSNRIGIGDATKAVYEASDAAERTQVEYHGTISTAVNSAFPNLIAKTSPFPVTELPETEVVEPEEDD